MSINKRVDSIIEKQIANAKGAVEFWQSGVRYSQNHSAKIRRKNEGLLRRSNAYLDFLLRCESLVSRVRSANIIKSILRNPILESEARESGD